LTDKILDEFNQNDNSISARDLGHYSIGLQNFIYENVLKEWEIDER